MAVPARHIRGIEAVQGPRFDDDVAENLVDRVPEVQITVGIGRAVVEDVFGPPGARRANFSVQPSPATVATLWLPLGQAGLHGRPCGAGSGIFVFTHK